MRCQKCNNEINPGQEVCLNCGHILGYESEESKTCVHCNRQIPISYKKCPYCKKKQASRKQKIIFFLLLLIATFLNYKIIDNLKERNELARDRDYEKYCQDLSYEELVRRNKHYDESYIRLEGIIKNVESVSELMHLIKISMYVEDNKDYEVDVYYLNLNSKGLMNKDKIEIYGKYKTLKGNKPVINAQIVNRL